MTTFTKRIPSLTNLAWVNIAGVALLILTGFGLFLLPLSLLGATGTRLSEWLARSPRR